MLSCIHSAALRCRHKRKGDTSNAGAKLVWGLVSLGQQLWVMSCLSTSNRGDCPLIRSLYATYIYTQREQCLLQILFRTRRNVKERQERNYPYVPANSRSYCVAELREQRQTMVLHRYRHHGDLGLSRARVRHVRVRV
jgi:hypothetical protein